MVWTQSTEYLIFKLITEDRQAHTKKQVTLLSQANFANYQEIAENMS